MMRRSSFHNQGAVPVRKELVIPVFLILITIALFSQTGGYDFVNYDDPQYVSENPHVLSGLTREGIAWAVSTFHMGNWHPLTWLSHMLDAELYGRDPGGHHLTNVLFHIVNALLLFGVLSCMTGASWRSGFVAVLFAVHPLHVESVAWISERKDVLSTFFWFLTMLAYYRYTQQTGIGRYLAVMMLYVLGLMAKPMLVTLPCVLLLLDIWPLQRLRRRAFASASGIGPFIRSFYPLLIEKIPLLLPAVISSWLTVAAQKSSRAVASLDVFSFAARLGNALLSYAGYIRQMFWPTDLAVFYPHPDTIPLWQALAAFGLIFSISVLAIRALKEHPYLFTGWFWYLGTLVPVIGLVQVGSQARADRYTYVPLVGLFMMIAWGVPHLLSALRYRRPVFVSMAALSVLWFSVLTDMQVKKWRDSVTLFQHALEVSGDNVIALNNLGTGLAAQGRYRQAVSVFRRALAIMPDDRAGYNNLANAWFHLGELEKALRAYQQILKIDPDNAVANYNIGVVREKTGQPEEARRYYAAALQSDPAYADAHTNMALLLEKRGERDRAAAHYRTAIQSDPDDARAHYNYGKLLVQMNRIDKALEQFQAAVRCDPEYADAYNNIGVLAVRQGNFQKAVMHYQKALAVDPTHAEARKNYNYLKMIANRKKQETKIPEGKER